MNSTVDYAITYIKHGYAQALEQGCDCFICQLTNQEIGFSIDEIDAIKEAISHLDFNINTHISLLPRGKKLIDNKNILFDGLRTIYTKEIAK